MWSTNNCFVVTVCFLLAISVEARDDTRCRENERRALMEFKAEASDEYGILSSWNTSKEEDCCNWKGIRCDNYTGHVTVVNIRSNYNHLTDDWYGLSGKVSPSLAELKHLKYLNLSYNQFRGKIPQQLGNLTNLISIDLGNNQGLSVENLDWLIHLRLLKHLDLTHVNLNNSNNWLQQIYKLSSLTELLLSSCNLPDYPLLPVKDTAYFNSLSVVDFSFNDFYSQSSYTWLFNFTTSLVHVALLGNYFGGPIPETFGRMMSLEYLNMANCQLEGELPRSFRNLSRLHTLNLDLNDFSGTLSVFLHPLADNNKNSLGVLSLGENKFSGSLPDFTRFPSLRDISLYENKLSGPFPENFGQTFGLVNLNLYNNQLTGPFPDLTLFSSLENLQLYNNKLEDNIPEAYLSNLSKLTYLDLSFNSLSLNFSLAWVPPFQLDVLILENCTLGPQFPNWIKSQRNFSILDISSTRISDAIPLWFWDHLSPRVRYLSMSNNNIQGTLPDLSLKFNATDYAWIDLGSNRLSGPIPSLPINIGVLVLSKNTFNGSLYFVCNPSYTYFSLLDLSDNQLSGDLPDCLMNVNQLDTLILANNNLSGTIPSSITSLDQLEILQLHNNNFSGEFPSSLKNCTNLVLLDLSENKFSGEVPAWIGTHLTSLIVFSLRQNEFFGRIPLRICHLKSAQILDFSLNNLSGTIPSCIHNITSWIEKEMYPGANPLADLSIGDFSGNTKYLGNAVVQWKGVPSEYRSTLQLLNLIDLSSNSLNGQIPEEFASLTELISLNLSRNKLTGTIISKIGQMKFLEILDLSRNQLSGEIPTSLANLTLLSVLDLSNNNLAGPIPPGTQLQSFNASIYAGNELCGLPLPNKCGHVLSPSFQHNDDDKISETRFYVCLILGFVTGFWGLVGPIMLKRTWRHAYYKLLDKITDWIFLTTTLHMSTLKQRLYN